MNDDMKYCRCKKEYTIDEIGNQKNIQKNAILSFRLEENFCKRYKLLDATKTWAVYLDEELFRNYFEEVKLCKECKNCIEWREKHYCEYELEKYVNGCTDELTPIDETTVACNKYFEQYQSK